MAELIWSDDAISDLEGIYDYIARDSPLYARHQAERISTSIERLLQHPDSGRHLPEFQNLPHREVIEVKARIMENPEERTTFMKNLKDIISSKVK